MTNSNGQQKLNPKLQQFVEELNVLQEKYLYQVTPALQVTPNGIIPVIKIIDKIPPKTEVKPVTSVVEPIVEKPVSEVPVKPPEVEQKKEVN